MEIISKLNSNRTHVEFFQRQKNFLMLFANWSRCWFWFELKIFSHIRSVWTF